MPSSLVKLFGTEEQPAETRTLTAGPLSVELDAGNLRYIRYQGHEGLRAVSYVVRDEVWGTFNPRIENFEIEESEAGFTVSYDGVCSGGGQELRYRARITGQADGSLTFEGTGIPVTDFLTNRTGFVVLHPIVGVSGRPVEVLRVDGRTETTTFPEAIDPKQPIMDIRALTHEVAPGLKVTCTMEGDTFEMEDQRNWTDASYKTYVRPLALPMPYTLAKGETFEQAVRVTFAGRPAAPAAGAGDTAVDVVLGEARGRVPDFGMALDPESAAAARSHAGALGSLSPAFYSALLDLREACADALADYQAIAQAHGVPLGLEVIVPAESDPDETLGRLARDVADAGIVPETVAVTRSDHLAFVVPGTVFTDSHDFDVIYAAARKHFPSARLGGGNFIYFTELNRMPPPFAQLDFVCHGTCAIVHAADDRSVTETIECLPALVGSGRALFGERHYRVGPGGIGTQFAPFGGGPTPNPDNVRVTMTRDDPRQRGLLGAAWHLGYGARMAECGVDSVILGAPVGPFGVIHHDLGKPAPGFEGRDGAVYPVYHVMRGLYGACGRQRLVTESSSPRVVQALAVQSDEGIELWLANLSGETRRIRLSGTSASAARASLLEEACFDDAVAAADAFDAAEHELALDDLSLAPYAVARLRLAS